MVSSTAALTVASCDDSDFSVATTSLDSKDSFTFLAPMIQINWQSSDRKDGQTTATKTDVPETSTLTPAVPGKETNSPIDDDPTRSSDTGASPTDSGQGVTSAPSPTNASNDGPDSPPSQQDQEGTTPDQQTQQQKDQNPPQQLSSSTKIGIGVAGGAVAAVAIILIVFYFWRRRNSRQEDAELDRLYGMKHVNTGSSSDLTAHHGPGGHDDIPGWYRGARPFSPLTPTVRVESPSGGLGANLNGGYMGINGGVGGMNGNGGPGRGLMPPNSPYYRPYRPNMP